MKFPQINNQRLILLLILFYIVTGALFIALPHKKLDFNQSRYEAIVVKACTGTFGEIDPRQKTSPELKKFQIKLKKFIDRDLNELSCAEMPADTALVFLGDREVSYSESYARAHYYMSLIISCLWSIFGVKWAVVKIAYLFLYGLSLAASCFFFRIFLPAPLTLALVIALHLSPGFFDIIFRLRDFAKTPFIFAGLGCMAAIVLQRRPFRQNLPYIAASAIATGIGLGFRVDLLIMVPLFLLTWFLLCPPATDGKWWQKPAGAMIFLALFLACGLPAITGWMGGDGRLAHVLILGQMDEFNEPLALNPAPYGLGYEYHDAHACLLINAQEQQNNLPIKNCIGESYLLASNDLYTKYILLTPGDQILRSISAFFQTAQRHYGLGAKAEFPAGILSMIIIFTSLTLMGAKAMRPALFLFFSLIYLSGITALQFSLRHSVYLDIYFWLLAGYLLCNLKTILPPRRTYAHMPAIMAVTFLLMVAGLFAGREWQESNMAGLIARLENADMKEIKWKIKNEAIKPNFGENDKRPFHASYLALDFKPDICGKDEIHLGIRYEGRKGFSESQTLTPLAKTDFTFFVPVFFKSGSGVFDGFTLPPDQQACLTGMRSADNFEAAGIPLTFMLYSKDPANYHQTSALFSKNSPRKSKSYKN